jgi:hypothetical protein
MPLIVVKIIDFKRLQDCRLNTFAVFLILLRGVYSNPQDCRFSLRSKRLLRNRTAGSILSPSSLYFYEGFIQTLSTKCYAFRWVFICVRVCEQAHTASTNKNPVTFVTGFVPFAGMSSIEIEAELNKLIYLENN